MEINSKDNQAYSYIFSIRTTMCDVMNGTWINSLAKLFCHEQVMFCVLNWKGQYIE
jgi:hypothetical protein